MLVLIRIDQATCLTKRKGEGIKEGLYILVMSQNKRSVMIHRGPDKNQ